MTTIIKKIILIAAGLFAIPSIAYATPSMAVLSETTQPIGHYELCQKNPAECRPSAKHSSDRLQLTKGMWSKMITINGAINTQIRPRTDQEIWGREEVWSYPVSEGDCEDYVLLKRKLLIKAGVPEGSLLITVVRQSDGSGHAVLTVVTDRGDFVLDNLTGTVRLWSETEYRFLKRQSQVNPGRWVDILDQRRITVARS